MRQITKATAAFALAALLPIFAGGVRAAEEATTSAQEKVLADQYTKEALELRQKIAEHKAMLQRYESGPRYEKVRKHGSLMGRHCKALIDDYTKAAENAEALATEHEKLAGVGAPAAEEAMTSEKILADQYTKEAAELRQKIAEHKAMLQRYENGPRYEKIRQHGNLMGRHCKALIDDYTKAAENAEALAKEHAGSGK